MANTRYKGGVAKAEVEAPNAVLHNYFQGGIGRQKRASAATGILASTLSSMAHGRMPVTLEVALLMEVATDGALRVEVLCPAKAEVIGQFLKLRCMGEASA